MAGMKYTPNDLMPIKMGGKVYPAKWSDQGWGMMTNWKRIDEDTWKVKIILTGEEHEREAVFSSNGSLSWPEET